MVDNPSIVTGFYFDNYKKLKESKVYEALNAMPKPVVHHLHLTAAAPVDYLVKLTYQDHVYFNDRDYLFKVSKNGINEDGFMKTTTLRKHWGDAQPFDEYIRNKILLTRDLVECLDSHPIWVNFQTKFILTCGK